MRAIFVAVCLVLVLAGCADEAVEARGPLPAGCSLTPRAEVPLHDHRRFILAQVSLNGQPVTMVIDTGAEVSTITAAAAARLGLEAAASDGTPRLLHGVAGDVATRALKVREVALSGKVVLRDTVLDISSLPSFAGVNPPVAGLLGGDILSRYEVELDVPGHRLALYSATNCNGYTPWQRAVAVPLQRARTTLLKVDVMVNGRPIQALLDSGARTTLVRRTAALRLGVSEAALAADPRLTGLGVGAGRAVFHQHRFDELGVPGDLDKDVIADIGELRLPGVEMLLGADYLGQRRVWISYATERLFLQH